MKSTALIFTAVLVVVLSHVAAAAPEADLWQFWQTSNEANAASIDHSPWQRFLNRYVETDDSGVNLVGYAAVSESDEQDLRDYVAGLQTLDPRRYSRAEQLAYWINLYNAATVDLVLQNPRKRSILRMG